MPVSNRLFVSGNYDLFELIGADETILQRRERATLKYERCGHSMCSLGEDKIIVSGSMRDKKSAKKCECYCIKDDRKIDLPDMNQGRFYHSSCSFNGRLVFVLGGKEQRSQYFTNSLDCLDFENMGKGW